MEGPLNCGDFICPKPRSDLLNNCRLSSVTLHTVEKADTMTKYKIEDKSVQRFSLVIRTAFFLVLLFYPYLERHCCDDTSKFTYTCSKTLMLIVYKIKRKEVDRKIKLSGLFRFTVLWYGNTLRIKCDSLHTYIYLLRKHISNLHAHFQQ
jgi:hypothetical protein